MIDLQQVADKFNQNFSNSAYSAKVEKGMLFVRNQGNGQVGPQTSFVVDQFGKKNVVPGNEWIDYQISKIMGIKKMSESVFKKIATGLYEGKMSEIELPTSRVDHRRLSVDEIKSVVAEEFKKAKDANKVKADQKNKHWTDVELEQQINWVKALKLKEFLVKETKEEK